MIYLVENFTVPDFGGFGWAAEPRDVVPTFSARVIALATGPKWEEIEVLHRAVHTRRKLGPTLLAQAPSMTFFDGKETSLGQVFLPSHFFIHIQPERFGRKSRAEATKYHPLDDWSVGYEAMDGCYYWMRTPKKDDDLSAWYEPDDRVFEVLTRDLAGQIWVDWHRFPPRQQTVMQHFAAELQVRGLS